MSKKDTTNAHSPETLDLRSHDVAGDRRRELLRLFPEIATEGGKLDLERLKLALGEAVDVGKERFGLTWPGKADCFRTIQAPSLATLRPCREESVDFDATGNLILEGDNLEVLKLLRKSYLGKVKMIYIDPPYNTGKDFTGECQVRECAAHPASSMAGHRLKSTRSRMNFASWLSWGASRRKPSRLARSA
jgi:hypothetical protein